MEELEQTKRLYNKMKAERDKLLLTPEEHKVNEMLGKAFIRFLELERLHPSEEQEMQHAIQLAQRIILSRPGMRQINAAIENRKEARNEQ